MNYKINLTFEWFAKKKNDISQINFLFFLNGKIINAVKARDWLEKIRTDESLVRDDMFIERLPTKCISPVRDDMNDSFDQLINSST